MLRFRLLCGKYARATIDRQQGTRSTGADKPADHDLQGANVPRVSHFVDRHEQHAQRLVGRPRLERKHRLFEAFLLLVG